MDTNPATKATMPPVRTAAGENRAEEWNQKDGEESGEANQEAYGTAGGSRLDVRAHGARILGDS